MAKAQTQNQQLKEWMRDKKHRMEAVQAAVEQIQKQFGQGSIMKLGDESKHVVDVIPSGIIPPI